MPVDIQPQNIVIVNSKIGEHSSPSFFVQFDTFWPKVTVVTFDGRMMMPLIDGYGEYNLQSVYPLLEMDKKSATYTRAAYSHGLNQVVSQVWRLPSTHDAHLESQADLQNFLWQIIRSGTTATSVADRVKLLRFVMSLDSTQYVFYQVDQWDTWQTVQQDISLPFEETCSIAVINSTDTQGLAGHFSSVLENSGMSVVRVTDDSLQLEKSVIEVDADQLNCNSVAKQVSVVFPETIAINNRQNVEQEYRAAMVIILGNDVATQFDSFTE